MMQLNFQDVEFFTFNFLLIQIFAVIQNISLTQIFLPVFFADPNFCIEPIILTQNFSLTQIF